MRGRIQEGKREEENKEGRVKDKENEERKEGETGKGKE